MQGGVSRVDITPPKGVAMAGYLGRTEPAKAIHDRLWVRAVSLVDGEERVLLISADLLLLDVALARDVRERIAAATGVPASHIMIACSHTHSGPLVTPRRTGPPDLSYVDELRDKLVQAAVEATGSVQPLRVGSGAVKLYLGVNRRQKSESSRVVLGRNPSGYADPYARLVVLAKENGSPLAILFSYGAHPVVLGPENLEISGDYAGVAAREVESNFAGSAVALFCQGFGGNVNVNCEQRTFDEVETIGAALGRAVLEEVKDIDPVDDGPLRVLTMGAPLPLEAPPSAAEAERMLYDARERLAGVLGRGQTVAAINEQRAAVEWASELARIAGRQGAPANVELDIQAIALGDTVLVALSGEVFAEYSKALAELSPFACTIPISNANGSIGYIPTAAAFDEGGYEVETAPSLNGVLGLRPEIESIVHHALSDLLTDLERRPAPDEEEEA
ncbi:neutral/alkaline non-lysosomal ceramidase N-terminal domain-containing protein [bacterium]|nr:neutral/alkaline non-lysosomal ceramidase N-terminal domain-containing protein [bacterium]